MPDIMPPGCYEICIREWIDDRSLAWFEGFAITKIKSGNTLLTGLVVDQAALHGLLGLIRDLNLTLISVNRIDRKEP